MIRVARRAILHAIAASGIAIGPAAHADYTIHTFAYPGNVSQQAWSINSHLQVPGYSNISESNGAAFVYNFRDGTFTTLPAPGDDKVAVPLGLNDVGISTGSINDGELGYTFDGSAYQTFSRDTLTFPRAINNAGIVTGYALNLPPPPGSGPIGIGWTYDSVTKQFASLDIDGYFTIPQGINSAGEIVGSATWNDITNPSAPASHAWVRSASGVATYFRINGKPTRARGINDLGVIVGSFDDAPGSTKGFVATTVPRGGGIVDIDISEVALVQVAGQSLTYASGINNAGYVSGFAGNVSPSDGSQTYPVGFVAIPPAAAQVTSLAATIASFGLPPGISGSYTTKLESAQAAIARGDIGAACGSLGALANHARAQSGKKLSPVQAQQVIDEAGDIRRSLGC
jgi:hypothetical protein